MNSREKDYLSAKEAIGFEPGNAVSQTLLNLVEQAVGVRKLNNIMAELGPPWPDANAIIDFLFEQLNIKWEVDNPKQLEQLDGRPKVFVANHPYGLPDAFALFQLLTQHRPNLKLFANKILAASQLKDERLLFVDPFMSVATRAQNRKSISTALTHLRNGGDLALFPGRICSHLKTSDWTISDSDWTDQVRRFVEASGGDMVPMFISGRNSMTFNLSGLIHPKIRTYMLLREFLRGGHNFRFRIGEPVSADQLQKVSRAMSVGTFSRSLTYSLKTGAPSLPDLPQLIAPEHLTADEKALIDRNPAPVAGKVVRSMLKRHPIIHEQGNFEIYQVETGIDDDLLDTICEVRLQAYAAESSIRDASELKDKYDKHYSHLVLWDREKTSIAGVYRYVLPKVIEGAIGSHNLVTNSIFEMSDEFRKLLPRAMELGRAAILPEYQKNFAPLMLLWRGFLEVPNRDKEIKYLFGPVTMGKAFSPVSHELLRRFVMRHCGDAEMDGFVIPKRQLDLDIPREVDIEKLDSACGSFAELGNIVNSIEGGKRTMPVLFRHYANAGCKFVGFGEWRELDNATAGLTIIDLKNASRSFIQRYFGKDGAAAFYAGR